MARTRDSYKLYAALAIGFLLLIVWMRGDVTGEGRAQNWLQDLGGEVMYIGSWEGHEECWGSTVGAVACSDGHREQW